jgi:hypothetical protein
MRDKFEKIVIGLQITLGILLAATLIKLLVKLFIYTWF